MNAEGSSAFSKKPATVPNHELDKSSLAFHVVFP
jgi:hypothetical protein